MLGGGSGAGEARGSSASLATLDAEEDEMLRLKQEEVPLPAAELHSEPPPEPPREPPPPPLAEDADGGDVSAIIYEIPKEPERSGEQGLGVTWVPRGPKVVRLEGLRVWEG